MMDAGNDVVGVWRIVMDVRDNSLGVRNVLTDISRCISLKLDLEAESQRRLSRSDRTYIEDM